MSPAVLSSFQTRRRISRRRGAPSESRTAAEGMTIILVKTKILFKSRRSGPPERPGSGAGWPEEPADRREEPADRQEKPARPPGQGGPPGGLPRGDGHH